MNAKGSCRATAAWGGLLPLRTLLPDHSSFLLMPASKLSVAGISFLPVACKNFASGPLTLAEWRRECILKRSFVISILDVHIVIK